MSGRAAKWVGGALAAVVVIAMGGYFTAVGLDRADKLASVTGAFIGLAGLFLAIYGAVTDRRPDPSPQQPSPALSTTEAVHNEIHGGIHHGPIVQGRDFGQVAHGSRPRPTPPPDDPDASAGG